MENPNFKQGIKALSTATNFTLTKDGIDILNRIIQFLNSRLVSHCLDNTKDGVMNVTAARDAVDATFTGNLKHCALAEGNRFLLLYSNGMMEYKPVKIVKRKKGKKALAVAALEFSRGMFDLTSLLFPEASLQEEAKKILCQLLEEMAVKISDFVQSNGKDNITQDDIRATIERILPQQLYAHAAAEGARMTLLFETGMLQEPTRKRSVAEVSTKRAYKRADAISEKKPRSVRKRKRSPPVEVGPMTKRRRMSSARKAPSKKAARKIMKKKVIRKSRKAPRKISRKRATRGVSRRAPSRKRRVSSKTVSRRAPRRKVSAKRRAPRKISTKRKTRSVSRRAPSRKKGVSKKTESITRKRPIRVSPKTIRKVSRKDAAKVKVVSEKITSSAVTELSRGIKKLNESYRQSISVPGMRIISECLCNLLDYLIVEIGKSKYSVIGPQEIRKTTMDVFPENLAGLAVANMNRITMTN